MISKRTIINYLFYVSLIFFGIGQYISSNFFMPVGEVVSVLPLLLILLFYILDSLYKKQISITINYKFYFFAAFLLSACYSYYVGMKWAVPGVDMLRVFTASLTVVMPFVGFLIWNIYNEKYDDFDPHNEALTAFNIYFIINLLGVGAGVKTLAHGFDDRITFPFSSGIYDGGNVLALMSILIFPNLIKLKGPFIRRAKHYAYFVAIVALLMIINSRLTTLNLLLIMGLFATRLAFMYIPIFIGSWFTLPTLLNSSKIVYAILSLPFLAVLFKRVDVYDVTTYNSRTFIWEPGLEWILKMKEGIWTGMGFKGPSTLKLYKDLTDKWMVDVYVLHSHSSLLDITISQGILGISLLAISIFFALQYYRRSFSKNRNDKGFYAIVLYGLFLMQFDGFLNPGGVGFAILSLCMSRVVIKRRKIQANTYEYNPPNMAGQAQQAKATQQATVQATKGG